MNAGAQATEEDVLRFWLGAPGDPPLAKAENWWKKDEAFDRELRDRFEAMLERGAHGELAEWRASPRGRVALVILLDQLSRNIFRGTPRSFSQDPLAREVALQALEAGDHRTVTPIEATFLLMPLMHAEDVAPQRRCHEAFRALCDRVPEEDPVHGVLAEYVGYAERHMAIIERFGRFPHRNAILGRPSTPEEEAFLKQPGSSF